MTPRDRSHCVFRHWDSGEEGMATVDGKIFKTCFISSLERDSILLSTSFTKASAHWSISSFLHSCPLYL